MPKSDKTINYTFEDMVKLKTMVDMHMNLDAKGYEGHGTFEYKGETYDTKYAYYLVLHLEQAFMPNKEGR
jgi:hypothetical protein